MLSLVWTAAGALLLGIPIWLAVTRLDVLLTGHPAMLVATVAVAALGVVAVVWAVATLVSGGRYDAEGDPEHPRHRTSAEQQLLARRRILLAVPALVVCVLLASALVYAKPFAATPAALAAMRSDSRVTVSDRLTWYEMTSARRNANGDVPAPTTGLVFTPGARVDPRAYATLLRPLAAAGYLVIVLKEPFNFALPGTDHAATAMEIHPKVRYWAVGGHSLGGVAAASFADRHPEVIGLLLWASYPAGRLDRQSLKVTSISGTADRLATPAEIAESRTDLPKSTQFVVVKGGVHSYFGDYGDQPGDGVPTISRKDAQAQIVRSSAARLGSMVPPARKK